MRIPWWAGVLAVIAALAAAAGVYFSQPYQWRGSVIDPPRPAPDIRLADSQGGEYHLAERSGRVTLVFFGYTTCPDVCPATLSDLRRVKARLAADAPVDYVFITVDPQRDSLERMAEYTALFEPSVHGLTGSEADLEPIWSAYGVARIRREGATPEGYLMDHSSHIYGIDANGNLRLTFAFGTPVEDIVSDVRAMLREARP